MTFLAEFGSGQVFWSMLWVFLFFIWIWLLITVFADIFRSPDMGGGAKALWTIFVIVLPNLDVFVYLIARGHKMHEHAVAQAKAQDDAARQYIHSVSVSGPSAADEIARLADLRGSKQPRPRLSASGPPARPPRRRWAEPGDDRAVRGLHGRPGPSPG